MEKERDDYLKAAAYERTPGRHDYRNGYYDRELLLSIGKIMLESTSYTKWGIFTDLCLNNMPDVTKLSCCPCLKWL